MVTIVPAGKEEKNDWCRQHGLPADCLALIAECAGRPVGYVLYALGGGRVTLLWAEADDRVLLEALVRAAMNAGYNAGAAEAAAVRPPDRKPSWPLRTSWNCSTARAAPANTAFSPIRP